jgi:hypothetical protein
MARSRRSAKVIGAAFERSIANYLAHELDDRIDKRAKTGAKDRGDISGLRIHGQRLVIEAKNCKRTELSSWLAEANREAGNDDALAGLVVHKRHGVTDPGRQLVTMTLDDLCALIDGARHGHRQDELDCSLGGTA